MTTEQPSRNGELLRQILLCIKTHHARPVLADSRQIPVFSTLKKFLKTACRLPSFPFQLIYQDTVSSIVQLAEMCLEGEFPSEITVFRSLSACSDLVDEDFVEQTVKLGLPTSQDEADFACARLGGLFALIVFEIRRMTDCRAHPTVSKVELIGALVTFAGITVSKPELQGCFFHALTTEMTSEFRPSLQVRETMESTVLSSLLWCTQNEYSNEYSKALVEFWEEGLCDVLEWTIGRLTEIRKFALIARDVVKLIIGVVKKVNKGRLFVANLLYSLRNVLEDFPNNTALVFDLNLLPAIDYTEETFLYGGGLVGFIMEKVSGADDDIETDSPGGGTDGCLEGLVQFVENLKPNDVEGSRGRKLRALSMVCAVWGDAQSPPEALDACLINCASDWANWAYREIPNLDENTADLVTELLLTFFGSAVGFRGVQVDSLGGMQSTIPLVKALWDKPVGENGQVRLLCLLPFLACLDVGIHKAACELVCGSLASESVKIQSTAVLLSPWMYGWFGKGHGAKEWVGDILRTVQMTDPTVQTATVEVIKLLPGAFGQGSINRQNYRCLRAGLWDACQTVHEIMEWNALGESCNGHGVGLDEPLGIQLKDLQPLCDPIWNSSDVKCTTNLISNVVYLVDHMHPDNLADSHGFLQILLEKMARFFDPDISVKFFLKQEILAAWSRKDATLDAHESLVNAVSRMLENEQEGTALINLLGLLKRLFCHVPVTDFSVTRLLKYLLHPSSFNQGIVKDVLQQINFVESYLKKGPEGSSVCLFLATHPDIIDRIVNIYDIKKTNLAWNILPDTVACICFGKEGANYPTAEQKKETLQHLECILGDEYFIVFKLIIPNFVAKGLWKGTDGFLELAQVVLKYNGSKWRKILERDAKEIVSHVVKMGGEVINWPSALESLTDVHNKLKECFRSLDEKCKVKQGKLLQLFCQDATKVNDIFRFIAKKLDSKCPDVRLHAWFSLLLVLTLLKDCLAGYLPPALAVLRCHLSKEQEPLNLTVGLEVCKLVLTTIFVDAPVWLGKTINQFVSMLLSCMEVGGEPATKARSLIKEIITTCCKSQPKLLSTLAPLPNNPSLTEISNEIRKCVVLDSKSDVFMHLYKGLRHTSSTVRSTVLHRLCDFIMENREWVAKWAARKAKGPPPQNFLIALLNSYMGVRHSKQGMEMKQRLACCVGLVGALDLGQTPDLEYRLATQRHISSSIPANFESFLKHTVDSHIVRILTTDKILSVSSAWALLKDLDPAIVSQLTTTSQKIVQCCGNPPVLSVELPETDVKMLTGKCALDVWLRCWIVHLTRHENLGGKQELTRHIVVAVWNDLPAITSVFMYLVHNALINGGQRARDDIKDVFITLLKNGNEEVVDQEKQQVVFHLLDTLEAWVESARRSDEKARIPAKDRDWMKVKTFLDGIDDRILADAAFNCRAHARALRYYDRLLLSQKRGGLNPAAFENKAFTNDEVTFLLQIYSGLEETDGLKGLVKLRPNGPTIFDKSIMASDWNHWEDAQKLYHRARRDLEKFSGQQMQSSQAGLEAHFAQCMSQGQLLRAELTCGLRAWNFHFVMNLAKEELWNVDNRAEIAAAGVAASLKMSKWEPLEAFMDCIDDVNHQELNSQWALSPQEGWNVEVARIIMMMRDSQKGDPLQAIQKARESLVVPLMLGAMESFSIAYPIMLRLHMLQEIQDVFNLTKNMEHLGGHQPDELLMWDSRLEMVQSSPARQSVLDLRIQLARFLGKEQMESDCWLHLTKTLRKAHVPHLAERANGNAQDANLSVQLERAKLLWMGNDPNRAIEELETALNGIKACSSMHSKMLRTLANWKWCRGYETEDRLQEIYATAKTMDENSPKAHLDFARFLDALYVKGRNAQMLGEGKHSNSSKLYLDYLPEIIENYAQAPCLDAEYTLESLPRVLTLFFEFGDDLTRKDLKTLGWELKRFGNKIHKLMDELWEDVPLNLWFQVFPQLVSRIIHPHTKTKNWIGKMIKSIIEEFTPQALWLFISVLNSSNRNRKATAEALVKQLRECGIIEPFQKFTDLMIDVCKSSDKASIERKIAASGDGWQNIIVPVQAAFSHSALSNLNSVPTVESIKPQVLSLKSLRSPKRLCFVGSDGQDYYFLAKPKDDLRQDFRLMEFCNIVNKQMQKDPPARARGLKMRTYMVLPLRSDAGILEWVPQLDSFRAKCNLVYRRDGLNIEAVCCEEGDQQGFENILRKYGPRLHKWWLLAFPNPTLWFRARQSFARSTALWSMVGHVLGIGDRHSENVNIDERTGECVHVDFGYLFDKGLSLRVPEVVPFRLTHNVIDAMGPAGVEGSFMEAATNILEVLRAHKQVLLVSVESFLHDPLVEWRADRGGNPEVLNALRVVQGRMEGALIGVYNVPSLPAPLACKTHARKLVEEASSKTLLAKMYRGWKSWY